MTLVSATRILNEDDIVEAFVRHNMAGLDHMIFLDNGSTDNTLAVLKSLKEEGLPLTVFQGPSLSFDELSANTWLYRLADQLHKADWVVFLDADEFLDLPAEASLAAVLGGEAVRAVEVALVNYQHTAEDDPAELVVPRRLRWRHRAPTGVKKLILRGGFGARVVIDAGNHGAFLDGRPMPAGPEPRIALAHYPGRAAWQELQKSVVGWLKVLAAGQPAIGHDRSTHYRGPFNALAQAPEKLLANPLFMNPPVDRRLLEERPLTYRGGDLRYTLASDPAMKALSMGLRYAEQLARQHGRLADQSAEARALLDGWNGSRKFLF